MLFGRDHELVVLRTLIESGRSAVVFGEAGVGKTALVHETFGAAPGLAEAGALATLSWHPYLPFRRLLGRPIEGDAPYVASEVEQAVGERLLFLDDYQWADRETRASVQLLAGRGRSVAAVRRGDPASEEALEELRGVGFGLVVLEPLVAEPAAQLLRMLRPGIGAAAVEDLVTRTGGNPLLLEELARTGEPSESLQLALAARLRSLTKPGRDAMRLLALAGRPLDRTILGAGGPELVEAGLAVEADNRLAVRHALFADAAAAEVTNSKRRDVHLRLAEALEEPGERARHYAAGGDRTQALDQALRAVAGATAPGERAAHLEIAALSADGSEADRLRLDAAEALAEAGLGQQALSVLDLVASHDADLIARRHLYRSRVALDAEDFEGARAECEAGLGVVSGSGSEVEARLALEDAQIAQTRALLFDLDPAIAREKADRALALARGSAAREALARRLLASIALFAREDGWEEEYRSALELAERADSQDIEFAIASSLGFALLLSGRLDGAKEIYERSATRAEARHLARWSHRLRGALVGVHWHAGALVRAVEHAEALAKFPGADANDFYVSQALGDIGRYDDSLVRAHRMVDRSLPTWQSKGEALWALCDAELAAGHPREAERVADEALELFGSEGPAVFVQLTRAWARYDLSRPPDRTEIEAGQPIVEGAPPELLGLCLLCAGRHDEAAAAFAQAASLWKGRHFRGHLRSLWAHGEALRLAGRGAEATLALERAESVAVAHDHAALLKRIRRSLRIAGVRRSASRGPESGLLTNREREVLTLVAAGASNAEIAHRLGLGRPTVDRLVRSASRKLGARTRAQAAARALGT